MGDSSKTFGKPQTPLLLLLAICLSTLSVQAKYGGGTGEHNDPYLIYDANQMNAIGTDQNDWDNHFKLMADIDFGDDAAAQFSTIGSDYNPFAGVFDGNDHTISHLTTRLFGSVTGGEIRNLGLMEPNIVVEDSSLALYLSEGIIDNCYVEGGSISGGEDRASLVVWNYGTITNCYSSASVLGFNHAGGLVGFNNGIISHCHSSGAVSGGGPVGGLVGVNVDGTIINCWSSGTVSGISQIGGGFAGANFGTIINCGSSATVSGLLAIGGLVGTNTGTITTCYTKGGVSGQCILGGLVGVNRAGHITDSYAASDVLGQDNIGGLVGSNDEGGSITNCYAAGHVSGDDQVGGLVGANAATIADSFWDVNTSGLDYSDGGVGKTTAEMQTQSTFTDAGWDFVGETKNGKEDIWRMCLDGVEYPCLSWEFYTFADFVCPDGVNFFDFSFFAERWAEDNCAVSNDCEGRDLDQLGSVDIKDLRIFSDNWLKGF